MSLYDKASLVLIPSGTKAGTVYSQKPTSGDGDFDFTRSTYATRVNSQGLIEKERSNLLLQSNTFDTTWETYDINTPTNGFSGYDGSSDAWLIQENAANANHWIRQSSSITSGIGTFSFYAKKKDYDFIQFVRSGDGSEFANFNINNGTIGNYSGSLIDVNIESKGNGWYRCSVTYSFNTNAFVGIALIRSDVSSRYDVYLGNGTNGTYIQDAQVEQGLVATDYIETTTSAVYTGITDNVPRLDYDGDCPSLLLEPSRTNKLTHSEYINTTTFGLTADLTIDNNQATSPEGLNNAAKLTPNTNPTYHQLRTNAATANGNDIVSCFVKADGYNYAQIASWATGTDYVNFNLTDGSVSAVGSSGPSVYGIDDYGDGWYRIYANVQASGGGIVGIGVITYATAAWSQSFAGNGTDGILIYGAQIEEGSYATSYIPTYGTSVTRNEDNGSALNIASLIGQTEGTILIDGKTNYDNTASRALLHINFDTTNNIGINLRNSSGQPFISVAFRSQNALAFFSNSPAFSENFKYAISYKSGNTKIYLNGTLVDTKTETFSFSETLDSVHLNDGYAQSSSQSSLNKVLLFSTALTDQECIDLTT